MRSLGTLRAWFAAAVLPLSLWALLCGTALAADEFDGLRCGSNIRKALIGKHVTPERVVVIEKRHQGLGLKDLGGTEISDRVFLISWRICGSEYALLLDGRLIRDVLQFPPHSARTPEMIGRCQADGKEIPETVLAVLDNRAGPDARHASANTMLPATAAWRIDETEKRFVKLPIANLRCRLDDVVTADAGW